MVVMKYGIFLILFLVTMIFFLENMMKIPRYHMPLHSVQQKKDKLNVSLKYELKNL